MSHRPSAIRNRSVRSIALVAVCAGALIVSCGGNNAEDDDGATGGISASAGGKANTSAGGVPSTGGTRATGGRKNTGGTTAVKTSAPTCTTAMRGQQGCPCLDPLSTDGGPTCFAGYCSNIQNVCCSYAGSCDVIANSGTGGKSGIGGASNAGGQTGIGGTKTSAGGTENDAGGDEDAGHEEVGGGVAVGGSSGTSTIVTGATGGVTSTGGTSATTTWSSGGIASIGGAGGVGGITSTSTQATGGADSGVEDAGEPTSICEGSPGPNLPAGQTCTGSETCQFFFGTSPNFTLWTCKCLQGFVQCTLG